MIYWNLKGNYYNLNHCGRIYREGKVIYIYSPDWKTTEVIVFDNPEEAEFKMNDINSIG